MSSRTYSANLESYMRREFIVNISYESKRDAIEDGEV